jgi:hypothetical protein
LHASKKAVAAQFYQLLFIVSSAGPQQVDNKPPATERRLFSYIKNSFFFAASPQNIRRLLLGQLFVVSIHIMTTSDATEAWLSTMETSGKDVKLHYIFDDLQTSVLF